MRRSSLDYVRHIADEVSFAIEQTSQLTEDDFMTNGLVQRAVVRSLEIIGEASKQIDPEFREKAAEIDWSGMAKMRDKLIHHYFGVDYEIVWQVVNDELPNLQAVLQKLIQNESGD